MRQADYVLEQTGNFDHFKQNTIRQITEQYGISKEAATRAFQDCMAFGYAVVLPISANYPNGVMIETDYARQKIAIG